MAILHAKSPCCRAVVHRFGGRRRRCSRCGRTWSIRSCRRGRKSIRIDKQLPSAVLIDKQSVKVMARRRHRSAGTVRRHICQAFRTVVSEPMKLSLPDGELVLLIDGLVAILRGKRRRAKGAVRRNKEALQDSGGLPRRSAVGYCTTWR